MNYEQYLIFLLVLSASFAFAENFDSISEWGTEKFIVSEDSNVLQINFIGQTPGDGTMTFNKSIQINASISVQDLGSLIYNWNETNFTVYDSSLILMYNFDNLSSLGDNSTVTLDSINGNLGGVNGAIWNPNGKYGGAFNFDGTSNYINTSALNVSLDSITMTAWIKGNYTGPYTGIIFSRDLTQAWGLGYRDLSGQITYTWNDNNPNTFNWVSGLSSDPNLWSFVALTLNSSLATLYVSNSSGLYSSYNAIPHSVQNLDTEVLIGYDSYSEDRYFDGDIDEVKIWNRSLSSSEIYQQYISNLQKYNSTQWYLYVNQSKNSTSELEEGTYTYQIFSEDRNGNFSSTEERSVTIQEEQISFTPLSSDSNATESRMIGKYLNHTNWDGVSYPIVSGLNNVNYGCGGTGSFPAVANGYVYVGSYDGNLYQLNASNISQKIANFSTGNTIYTSPVIVNGYVYVGSDDGNLYQLNASNISQKIGQYTTGGAVRTSAAVANGYIYFGSTDNTFYQFNASNISQKIAEFHSSGAVTKSSAAVANDYIYIADFYDWNIHQLNASNVSQEIASYGTSWAITSSPAVANGYIYFGSWDNRLYQLNASDVSQEIAEFSTGGKVQSSPAVANGYVYVGSEDGNLYQLNASDISQEIAEFLTGGEVQSSPAVANGYVYVGSEDGNLYQLNASNVSQEIASYTSIGSIQSSPAIANGYVYVGSDDGNLYQLNASNISLENVFLELEDISYPQFSNYQDNNASLYGSGIALFNVTVLNTNGTVFLEINNENITATNLQGDVYNVSINISTGTYNYTWYSYGNGSNNLQNYSLTRYYTINPAAASATETFNENIPPANAKRNYILERETKERELKISAWILPNKTVLTKIKKDKGTGLKEIELKTKNWLSGEINVIVYNETLDFCSIEYDGNYKIYKILDFNNSFNDESIDFARLEIGVSKDWIYSNNISEIKFVRCSTEFDEVNSSYKSESENEGIYDVYIKGFSAYAILGTLEDDEDLNVDSRDILIESSKNNSIKTVFWIVLIMIISGLIFLIGKNIFLNKKISA